MELKLPHAKDLLELRGRRDVHGEQRREIVEEELRPARNIPHPGLDLRAKPPPHGCGVGCGGGYRVGG